MSEIMKASVLKDKNGAEVHLMDERLPQVTEADDGMPLRVENGEYKVGKLQKNAVEGLVTDLIMYGESLDNKAPKDHTHSYADITDKPSAFTPSAHSHEQSEVNGLTNALAGKAPVSHSHAYSEITGKPEAFPPETHKHAKGDVEGLVTDLINIYSALNDKDAAIAEKADKVHTHAFSEITDKPDTFLTEADKQDIVNDTLSALAGADTSDAAVAALTSKVSVMETKVENMREDLAYVGRELDTLEVTFVAMIHPTYVLDDPDKMTFMYTSRVLDKEWNETLYDDITLLSPTGDVYAGKGIEDYYTRKKLATEEYVQEAMILTAPNGNKFRLTVDNNGSLSTVAVE